MCNPSTTEQTFSSLWLLCLVLAICPRAEAHYLDHLRAPYERHVDAMVAEGRSLVTSLQRPGSQDAICGPLPKKLLLVSLCAAEHRATWQEGWSQFAKQNELELLVLGPDTLPLDGSVTGSPGTIAKSLLDADKCEAAERVLGWDALAKAGGALVSPQLSAPQAADAERVFLSLFSLCGLVAPVSENIRNIRHGQSGLIVSDWLVLSPPHHSIIDQMVENSGANVASLLSYDKQTPLDYLAGEVFFSRHINCSITLLSLSIYDTLAPRSASPPAAD